MSIADTRYLVETDWLETHLDDPNLRILDCTTFVRASEDGYFMESGLQEWRKAHIPGSVFADVMSRLGVREDVFVVLYDAFINIWAARLWWMLRSFGFENAAILNGGWKKWKREKRPVSTDLIHLGNC